MAGERDTVITRAAIRAIDDYRRANYGGHYCPECGREIDNGRERDHALACIALRRATETELKDRKVL